MNQQQTPKAPVQRRNKSVSIQFGSTKECRRITRFSDLFTRSTSQRTIQSNNSVERERMLSQWEVLLRNFSKDACKQSQRCHTNLDQDLEWRDKKIFPTGSSYEGTWGAFGMCGFGRYTFPNGVKYEGCFEDGNFHGEGVMRYPDGTTLKGRWVQGELTEKIIIFSDGVKYRKDNTWEWNYCKDPDRRYAREFEELLPAGVPTLTSELPSREIPDGTYDTGDGVFKPETGCVYSYEDPTTPLRMAGKQADQNWIVNNCRKNPDDPVGPCPFLYPQWVEPTTATLSETPPPLIPATSCVFDNKDWSNIVNYDESLWRTPAQHRMPCRDGEGVPDRDAESFAGFRVESGSISTKEFLPPVGSSKAPFVMESWIKESR